MKSWIRDHPIAAAAIGTLLAIAATTAMDAVGLSNFSAFPLIPCLSCSGTCNGCRAPRLVRHLPYAFNPSALLRSRCSENFPIIRLVNLQKRCTDFRL
jgi:hypothetical protein